MQLVPKLPAGRSRGLDTSGLDRKIRTRPGAIPVGVPAEGKLVRVTEPTTAAGWRRP